MTLYLWNHFFLIWVVFFFLIKKVTAGGQMCVCTCRYGMCKNVKSIKWENWYFLGVLRNTSMTYSRFIYFEFLHTFKVSLSCRLSNLYYNMQLVLLSEIHSNPLKFVLQDITLLAWKLLRCNITHILWKHVTWCGMYITWLIIFQQQKEVWDLLCKFNHVWFATNFACNMKLMLLNFCSFFNGLRNFY